MNNIIKFLIILLLAIFSFLMLNCSPVPVYRIETIDKDVEYYYGREVINKSDSSAQVSLSFEQIQNNNSIFYLDLNNLSKESHSLNPSDVYYENLTDNPVTRSKDPVRFYALDPELTLLSLDKGINQTEASENTRRGLSCLVSTVDFVGAVASAGKKKTAEEVKRENEQRENRRIEDQNSRSEYKQNLNELDSQKDYWMNDVLRKTTVHPEEKVSGFIHFNVNPNAELIKVTVPFGQSVYSFNYRQIRIK